MSKRKIPLLCQIRFGGITFLISGHFGKEQDFGVYLTTVASSSITIVRMTNVIDSHTILIQNRDYLPASSGFGFSRRANIHPIRPEHEPIIRIVIYKRFLICIGI